MPPQSRPDGAAPAAIARGPAVWALALGQTLGYACLFYIFAGLVLFWTRDLGWSKSTLAAGPMLALLISAGLAPVMGRLVDIGRGPEVLAGGAALGALSLGCLALVQTPAQWMILWAVNGVAQAACLYEVCFAFLIRRLGPEARAAIIRVTLLAGFASTLAFPAFALVATTFGWRVSVWVAAALMGLVAAPLQFWAGRLIRKMAPPPRAGTQARKPVMAILRAPAFLGLAALFALISLNHWMVTHFLIPIFVTQGSPEALAILAASVVGPAQVAGRLVLMRFEARIGNAQATAITLGTLVLAALLLGATGLHPAVTFGYALLQGAAIGVTTILRPVLIADVMGDSDYGAIAGAIQMPALVAAAIAPMLGAVLIEGPGHWALVGTSIALTFVAASLARRLRAG